MTKKDYVIVADAISISLNYARGAVRDPRDYKVVKATVDTIIQQLTIVFTSDNPRFSPSRFRNYIEGRLTK